MSRLLFVGIFFVFLYTVESCCPDGWFRFQGSCYFFETQRESWYTANKYCEALHGHLVVLETEDEYKFVKAQLLKMNRGLTDFEYWTSGNDIAVEDVWVWNYTMEKVTLTDWRPGEPTHGTEDCLGLYYIRGTLGLNDAPCDVALEFVCEIDNGDEEVIVG